MKITFTFTDTPDLSTIPKDGIYQTHLEIPDAATHLIGYEERILAISNMVGKLTNVCLHITCKEAGLKNHPIKLVSTLNANTSVYTSINVSTIYFQRFYTRRSQNRQLKILSPVSPVIPQPYLYRRGKRHGLQKNLLQLGNYWCKSETDHEYANFINTIAEQVTVLLNAEPAPNATQQWTCAGFHPWWVDNTLITLQNNRTKKREAERRKQEREEKKRREQEAKQTAKSSTNNTPLPQTGAGRRPGAIPGIFMGVQFRSQLEIRFATELESRQIRWVYEAERLGDGNYLVDFYLPDCKCWVEVKGQFEPRDHYLLKEVADYLKRERNERLYVFTQRKVYLISETDFQELSRDSFWTALTTV
jgi:hypothetical protein